MSFNKKNKIIIKRDLPEAMFIGIISQKLPHEIINVLKKKFNIEFVRKNISDIEVFVAKDESDRLVFTSNNNLLKDFIVDYILVIISEKLIQVDKYMLNELKINDIILGAYVLNVPKKKSEQIISMLYSLL